MRKFRRKIVYNQKDLWYNDKRWDIGIKFSKTAKTEKEKEKQYKDAAIYLEKSWILHDSISKLDKCRTLIEMQEKYDQQKVKVFVRSYSVILSLGCS